MPPNKKRPKLASTENQDVPENQNVPVEFIGIWSEHWGNGQLRYRGSFKRNRKRVGQHISFWENGTLECVSFWREGQIVGTMIHFNESGNKTYEVDFGVDGGCSRSFVKRVYGELSGNLIQTEEWCNGTLIEEWNEFDSDIELKNAMDKIVSESVQKMKSGNREAFDPRHIHDSELPLYEFLDSLDDDLAEPQ